MELSVGKLKIFVAVLTATVLSGCALTRSEVDVSVGSPTTASIREPSDDKTVFISSVRDQRAFHESPSSPNIPSLDPSATSSDAIKQRAVGRKRNGWGKAMGDILLSEGTTVASLTSAAIRRAFSEKGYKTLDDAGQVTPDTYVVDADIDQFWTWMNPGFWALTISTEISTNLKIREGSSEKSALISVKAADTFQTGLESNYIEVMNAALTQYIEELKLKLQ